MKFLNFKKVLCLSPHPDDVEIAMMGTIIKHCNTFFDILCLTKGGSMGFDKTNDADRRAEILSVWYSLNCNNIKLNNSKYEYFEETNESGWIYHIEKDFLSKEKYDCIFIPTRDDSMFEHRYVNQFGSALCRASLISLIEYNTISTLSTWQANLFVDISKFYGLKLESLKKFESQQHKPYFHKLVLDSFHNNFQCSKKGLNIIEKFKFIDLYC